ncbi:unnamed protein product [Paramecium sonneborni]|uniref:Tetratricopeptide repeat protein n=1 Tax=Paramecium sonneborni TaxID=65129 RepID=A0A8S1Q7U2_9CILI|nr:unnamed protein product [Paramecium sonneborni]
MNQTHQCQNPLHKDKDDVIEFFCFDQCCKEQKLLCYKCFQSDMHKDHRNKIYKLSSVNEQTKELNNLCSNLINDIKNQQIQLTNSIDELKFTLNHKFQLSFNNIQKFSFAQLESYFQGLLKFKQDQTLVQEEVLSLMQLTIQQVNETIKNLKLKQELYYQAPAEDQKKVIELQLQCTQLLNQNNLLKAQDIMNQTLRIDPNNKISLTENGKILLQKTEYFEAFHSFDRAVKIDPNYKEAINGLGDSLRGRNKFSDALKHYEKTLSLDQNNQQALIGKAHCLIKDRKFVDARKIFDNIQDKKNIEVIWGQAELLRMEGKDDAAISQYNQVLLINNEHIESLSGKGDCYRLKRQFDQAMEFLQKANKLNQKHVVTLVRIGDCLRQQQMYKEAINYYSEALSIDPQEQWASEKLVECQNLIRRRY